MSKNSNLCNQNSGKINWGTPKKLFNYLNDIYKFELDPCSDGTNTLCENYFTEEDNGLLQDWGGEKCFYEPSLQSGNW